MFNHHQPNLENMQQYLNQENEKGDGQGPNWWSIPAGMSSVRILPPWDPTGRVALPVFMHPIEYKGEGMSFTKYNWTCVNKTFNKPCAICEGLAGLAASGVDISNWEANRRQFYFNAIVMHDPTFDNKGKGTAPGTHVLMKAPKTFYDWVIAQITNPMIGDITSITNGIDVYVTKEGTGLGTSYNMTLSPNGRTPIPQEYLDKITDLYNLDDVFSAGFDQKQVDDLVNHLKKSAGVLNNAIPNMQQQMAGYTQAPNQFNPGAPIAPQFNAAPSQFNPTGTGIPMGANPYGQPAATPMSMPTSTAPSVAPANFPQAVNPNTTIPTTSPSDSQSNNPKCFGQYDAGAVNCVVCPMEMQCSKITNG